MIMESSLWERCVDFHGHICPGLMIGYRASLLAGRLLDLEFSEDEDVLCITENDACGVDAVQVITGCTAGKGNLIFRIRGKQAFTFCDRKSGRAIRIVLKPGPSGLSRDERFVYLRDSSDEELFDVQDVTTPVPERARIYETCICSVCGEAAGEKWMTERDGRMICMDCLEKDRTL